MKRQPLRLNVRLLIGTALSVMALGAGIHIVHEYQVSRNAKVVFQRAIVARDEGQSQQAIRLLSEYLGLEPRDPSNAISQLAVLLDDAAHSQSERTRACATLEEALRREPDRNDLRRRLVTVAMNLGRYRLAKAHWTKLSDAADAETMIVGARILRALDDFRGSAKLYLRSIDRSDNEIEYYTELVSLIRRRPDDVPLQDVDPLHQESSDVEIVADRLLETMVTKGKPACLALHARAADRKQRGHLDEAFADVARALDECENADSLSLAADIALARGEVAMLEGRPEEADQQRNLAREFADRGLNLTPPDLRSFLTLSQIARQQGSLDDAEQQLRKGIRQFDSVKQLGTPAAPATDVDIRLRWTLADLLVDRASTGSQENSDASLKEVQEIIKGLRRAGVTLALVDFLEAKVLFQQQHWQLARSKLENIRPLVADLPDLVKQIDMSLGRCCDHLGNPEAKVDVFRRALGSDPVWVAGRMHLAAALVGTNRIDEAISEYRSLFGKVLEAPLACARLLIAQNIKRPEGRRQWADIEEALSLAERRSPQATQNQIVRSASLICQKKYTHAQALLEKAVEANPGDVALQIALSKLWLSRDDIPESLRLQNARGILDGAEEILGDRLELRLAKIVLASRNSRQSASVLLEQLMHDLDRLRPDDRALVLRSVAGAYAGIGMLEKARIIWQNFARNQPGDLLARLALVEIAAQSQDESTIAELLIEIRTIEGPTGPNGDFVEASLLLQKAARDRALVKDLNQAGRLLRQAAQMRPNWPAVPRTQGMLEDLLGNREEALSWFRKAIALGDRSPRAMSQLVEHLYEQKHFDEADQQLRLFAEEDPALLTGDLARLASNVAWQRQDFDAALRLASDVALNSTDFRDLIRLSQIRYVHGERGEPVEGPLRQAIDMAPDVPEPRIALVSWLSRIGRTADAQAAIQQALQKLPKELTDLTAARCYEVLDERKQASDHFLKALATSPHDLRILVPACDFFIRIGQTKEAEVYLNEIIKPETGAPELAVALARRRLALVVAFNGGYEDTIKAMQMLEQGRHKNRPISLAELRVKAAILSRRNTRRDRRELIQTMSEMRAHEPLSPAEEFQLARLYELTDDWQRSREILQGLLLENRSDKLLVSHYVESLIRHREFDEAQAWIPEMESLDVEPFAVMAFKARILTAQGETERAVLMIQDFIRQDRQDQTEAVQVERQRSTLSMAATLLMELGHPEMAESALRDRLETLDGKGRLLLATLVAQRGRVDEALRLCEAAESALPNLDVAQMTVAVLRQGTPSRGQIERGKLKLRKWAEAEPGSTVLLNYLANVSELQENYDEASDLYAQVLKIDPQDVWALNNLAFLAAMHRGRGDEGLQLISRAIRIAGPVASLLDTRAAIYLVLNDPKHAIRDLNTALNEKADASSYIRLVQAHLAGNNKRAAREAFQKAKELMNSASNLHALDATSYRALVEQFN